MKRRGKLLERFAVVVAVSGCLGCLVRQREYLVATGLVQTTGDSLPFRKFQRVRLPAGKNDAAGIGAYSFVLEDATGRVLFLRSFELQGHPYGHDFGPFTEILPYHSRTARIILKHNGRALSTVNVTAHSPKVSVTYPRGAERLRGRQTITWTASDADGDSLTYDVLYSVDRGKKWIALAVNLTSSSYAFDADRVPGGDYALIRVLATDGVNTGQGRSRVPFKVAKKVPQVAVISPRESATFFRNEPITLHGQAFDPEDGPLKDELFVWSSDIEGEIGRGREVVVDSLPPGKHVITVSVVDRDDNRGVARVLTTILSVLDLDSDRVGDDTDNCALAYNPDQTDLSRDGVGDACDDSDTDGYFDGSDNCPFRPNDQTDLDNDGIGDVCEGDLDDDGDVDVKDLERLLQDRGKTVGDSRCGQACDLDGDRLITARDADKLRLLCTRRDCATM